MPIDFDALVSANMSRIRNIARNHTNRRDAEDLVQEILIQLWRSQGSFRGDSSPETWLYRIAINTAITHQRKAIRARKGQMKDQSLRRETAFHDGLDPNQVLQEFIGQLNEVDRAVLTMYLDGLSALEMENVLGITANAINARVSRMKGRFAEQFVS